MNTNIIIETALLVGIVLVYSVLARVDFAEHVAAKVKNPTAAKAIFIAAAVPLVVAIGICVLLIIRAQCWLQNCDPALIKAALGL